MSFVGIVALVAIVTGAVLIFVPSAVILIAVYRGWREDISAAARLTDTILGPSEFIPKVGSPWHGPIGQAGEAIPPGAAVKWGDNGKIYLAALILAGLALLAVTPPASACGTVCTTRTHVVTPTVVVAPTIFTKFTAIIPVVEFPTYAAVLTPALPAVTAPVAPAPVAPAAAPAPAAPDLTPILRAFDSLNARLDKMEQRIQAMEKPAPAAPAIPPKMPKALDGPVSLTPSRGLQVASLKCAACHQRGREVSGGDFVLLEKAGFAALSRADVSAVATALARGRMPPKKCAACAKLDPGEGDSILAAIPR